MRIKLCIGLLALLCFLFPAKVMSEDLPLGVHLLEPGELDMVLPYRGDSDQFFVTIPMVITDTRKDVWERFFETAFKARVTPMVRWVTTFGDGYWNVPSREEIVKATTFLSSINWPGRRIIILFNEPNHAKEWGGKVNPQGYAEVALFAVNWLKTEKTIYEVLPAGLDAAAPNNATMADSLWFMEKMFRAQPQLFEMIDGWTSHSYPNPGFSSSPSRNGKNSMKGFELEQVKLKTMTGKDYPIYITETGWMQSRAVNKNLMSYYRYAAQNIWNKPQVKAVTVFVLRGFNGPYESFSLLDGNQKPTLQMKALESVMK
jgi:hypothetical protein